MRAPRRRARWIPLLLLTAVLGATATGCDGSVGVGIGVVVPGPYYGPYPGSIYIGGGRPPFWY